MTHLDNWFDDVTWELIFSLATADPTHHADVQVHRHASNIPLVCRRWNRVYSDSLLLWRTVVIDLAAIYSWAPLNQPFIRAVFDWLHRRREGLGHLTLINCHHIEGYTDLGAELQRLCPVAPRLHTLRLLDCVSPQGPCLAALQGCATLSHLTVSTAAPDTLCRVDPLHLPTAGVVALTALPVLSSLDLSFDGLLGNTADLAAVRHMTGLTSLRLSSRSESTLLLPEVMLAFHRLERLSLDNCRVPQISPAIAQALGSLTHLGLTSVLAATPRRKSGFTLWQALRHLPLLQELAVKDASANAGLPGTALCCAALTGLTVLGSKGLNGWRAGEGKAPATLKRLHLQDCSVDFAELPSSMPALHALTSLTWSNIREALPADLLHNTLLPRRLMHYPPFLFTLRHLAHLRLEYSGITELPAARASALLRLEELSLEGNPLGWDEWAPFVGVLTHEGGLKKLSLANTGLEALPEHVDEALRGVTELNLGRTLVVWRAGKLAALAKVGSLERVRIGAAPKELHCKEIQEGVFVGGEEGEGLAGLLP